MPDAHDENLRLSREIGRKAARRLRARERGGRPWFDLSAYGVVGWSIVLPTLAGLALGVWIDARWPSRFSWTLMLMVGGLFVGCWNAWRWISLEQRTIHDEGQDRPEGEVDD